MRACVRDIEGVILTSTHRRAGSTNIAILDGDACALEGNGGGGGIDKYAAHHTLHFHQLLSHQLPAVVLEVTSLSARPYIVPLVHAIWK